MADILELYPRLVVDDADEALAFYSRAFGGTVTERFAGPDGRVVHAVVQAGPARIAVKDADEVDRVPTGGGTIHALYVVDADAVAARMVDGGAQLIFPVADHDYGDRAGRLRDPFRHVWMVATRLS
jgi:uncharacterized glyoxalase superfamily protein PhnB